MSIDPQVLDDQGSCPVCSRLLVTLSLYWPLANQATLTARIPDLADTRASDDVSKARAVKALDWTIRNHRPIWLNDAGRDNQQNADATALGALTAITTKATYLAAKGLHATALKNAFAAWSALLASDASAANTARLAWRNRGGSLDVEGAWIARGARAAWGFYAPNLLWEAGGTFDSWNADVSIPSLVENRSNVSAACASVRTSEMALLTAMLAIT